MLNATLNMLLTIVDRGKGDGVAQLLQRDHAGCCFFLLRTVRDRAVMSAPRPRPPMPARASMPPEKAAPVVRGVRGAVVSTL